MRADSPASRGGRDRGVLLVPTYGWYDDNFAPDASIAGQYSSVEARFDSRARGRRLSIHRRTRGIDSPRIGDFMRDVNARVRQVSRRLRRRRRRRHRRHRTVPAPSTPTTSSSRIHTLPRPELYRGYANLWNVMGSTTIDDDARRWSSSAHVFGHSHLNVDRVIHGVRYVQHALGYPHERWIGANEPQK